MPGQELEDFANYWRESMINPDTGEPRPPGGSEHVDEFGVNGVDYANQLIPWCKGNSVSVDQTTLQLYRNLFDALIQNYRYRIRMGDATRRMKEIDGRAGLTSRDIENITASKSETRFNRQHLGGQATKNWQSAEYLFVQLLRMGIIKLYSSNNTENRKEGKIYDDIVSGKINQMWPEDWMPEGICAQLLKTYNSGGHIRLSFNNGWETYIRDYFGAPAGIPGVIPGSLQGGVVPPGTPQTMPLPLHIALSETLARAHGKGDSKNEWGKNQSRIRRQIADKAIDGEGDRIPLDDYYMIFSRNSAGHMADSFFHRSISDKSAARYELIEVVDSKPKKWDVKLEPEFLRWRELRRQRERLVE